MSSVHKSSTRRGQRSAAARGLPSARSAAANVATTASPTFNDASGGTAVVPYALPVLPSAFTFDNGSTPTATFAVNLPAAYAVQSVDVAYNFASNASGGQLNAASISLNADAYAFPSGVTQAGSVSVGGVTYGPSLTFSFTGSFSNGSGGSLTFTSIVFHITAPVTVMTLGGASLPALSLPATLANGGAAAAPATSVMNVPMTLSASMYIVSVSAAFSVAGVAPAPAPAPAGVALSQLDINTVPYSMTAPAAAGSASANVGAWYGPALTTNLFFTTPAAQPAGVLTVTNLSVTYVNLTGSGGGSAPPSTTGTILLLDTLTLLAAATQYQTATTELQTAIAQMNADAANAQAAAASAAAAAAAVQAAAAANATSAGALAQTATSLGSQCNGSNKKKHHHMSTGALLAYLCIVIAFISVIYFIVKSFALGAALKSSAALTMALEKEYDTQFDLEDDGEGGVPQFVDVVEQDDEY